MYEDVNISPEDKKKTAQYLWKELSNIPVNDDGEIELPFLHFPIGTFNEVIWHWMEDTFDLSIVEDLMTEGRYFLAVDWCDQGKRGIFCCHDGTTYFQEGRPFTEKEIHNILGAFDIVLSPSSIKMTEGELKEYINFYPLGEYSGYYGYVTK